MPGTLGHSLGRAWVRYGAALVAVIVAFLLRQALVDALGPGIPPYLTFYPAVMLVALFLGFGAGMTATLLAAALAAYWMLPPDRSFAIADPSEVAGLGLFVVVGLLAAIVSEWHRRTRVRAAEFETRVAAQRGQEAQQEAETRVRDEARASLEREKSVFQAVVNGARNSHLLYLDRDFNYVRVNEAYAASCGYTPEAMVGKNHFAVHPHEENQAIFTRVRDTGIPVEFHDKPFVFPDQPERGTTYWDWTLRPVNDREGRVEGLVFSMVETTERKRAELTLLEADRRKSEFLATLSHELRNPLAPIRYAFDLLAHEPDAETTVRARAVIDRQLRHLVRLVDDLLDVTRIGSNKLQLHKQVLLLTNVMQQAIEAAAPNIERGGHELVVLSAAEDVWLDGDPDRLVQVLTNLLNNAAKFTPPRGRVTVKAEASDSEVAISVTDNGIGIRPEDQGRVFDMFIQASDAEQGGLGIGLALVRGTVELHGGSVEVHSDGPGRGCEFVVRLPRARAPEASAAAGAEPDQSPSRRILVVDDSADAADMMRTLLELHGHEVRVAYDGFTALAVAAEFRPDIGLFDIGLPTMSGHELARRVREDPRTRAMYLIAVTGWGQEEDRQRSRQHGFDAHLTKPADHDAIRHLVAGAAKRGPRAEVNSGQ